MAEMGIDILAQRSKGFNEFEGQEFDLVVMVVPTPPRPAPFSPAEGSRYIMASTVQREWMAPRRTGCRRSEGAGMKSISG
jgi:protein-tyrosine-phosphatase